MESGTGTTFEAAKNSTSTGTGSSSNSEFGKMKAMEEFIKLKPPLFEGRFDPLASDSWLNTIKATLDSIGVQKEHRIAFATYLFDGSAEEWWEFRGGGFNQENTDWDMFETLFRQKFVIGIETEQDSLAEVQKITQKDNTVAEYHARFDEMSRHDPVMIANSALRCDQFRQGLRVNIRLHLARFKFTNFDELLTAALCAEADYNGRKEINGVAESCWCYFCSSIGHNTCDCPARQSSTTTVMQYHARFVEHFQFDPTTEEDHSWIGIKFKEGLLPRIRSMLQHVTFRNLNKLVDAAKRAEAKLEQKLERCRSKKERVPQESLLAVPANKTNQFANGSSGRSESCLCCLCGSFDHDLRDCPCRQSRSMTVAQYHTRFVEQFQFDMVTEDNHTSMGIKFKQGLKPEIQSTLKHLTFRDFNKLVDAAKRAEVVLEQEFEKSISRKKKLKNKNMKQGRIPQESVSVVGPMRNRFSSNKAAKGGRFKPYLVRGCAHQGHTKRTCPFRNFQRFRGEPDLVSFRSSKQTRRFWF